MPNQSFNEEEIKIKIKEVLKEIKGESENKQLYIKIKKILNSVEKQRLETGMKIYHSNRFAFLTEGSYFTTKRKKDIENDKIIIIKLYEEIKKIFLQIEQRLNLIDNSNLDYAIYFKDKNNRIKRLNTKQIDSKYLRKSSKGLLKTAGLQTYLKNLSEQQQADKKIIDITQHLDSFIGVIKATYSNNQKDIPNRTISYGRLTEAFERHLQSNLNHNINDAPPWNYNQVWKYIRESMGNVPWYLTGDVGGTQVKYLGSGDVRLSSQHTFQDLLNFFDYLLSNPIDNTMINNAYNIFVKQLNDSGDNEIKQASYQDIIKIIKENTKT